MEAKEVGISFSCVYMSFKVTKGLTKDASADKEWYDGGEGIRGRCEGVLGGIWVSHSVGGERGGGNCLCDRGKSGILDGES